MKISDGIRKWCDLSEADSIPCDELRDLADRIDREMVELPNDADGIPIHVWDTVYDRKSGSKMEVRSMSFNGQWHLTTNKGHINNTSLVACEMPDSFECIADELEAAKGWRDQNGEHNSLVSSVSTKTLGDWADRIRKLAKEDCE
jgi:hypothetical protein